MGKEVWSKIFDDLKNKGKLFSPRGQKTLEIEDYVINFHPINDRFCSFKDRNLSLKYLVGEMSWFLKGDPNDLRMESYSSFWKNIKNTYAPFYHSNYGEYFFKEKQFQYVYESLKKDKDSRQACMILCRKSVMMSNTKDKICTYAINFRIRENKLNMSIGMRSSDVIFGMGIDVFQFSVIYEMLFTILLDIYPNLQVGTYVHKSDSFHIYERHFDMLEKICNNGDYYDIICPKISSSSEVDYLLNDFSSTEELIRNKIETSDKFLDDNQFEFSKWCINKLKL